MDNEFIDDYRRLGISPGADWKELRAAYRERIRAWHPDRFQGDDRARAEAENRSKAINQSYRKLAGYHRRHGCLPLSAETGSDLADAVSAVEQGGDRGPADTAPNLQPGRFAGALRRPGIFWAAIGLLLLVPYSAVVLVPATEDDETGSTSVAPLPREATNDADPGDERYFTVGSRIGDVYAVQGVPTKTEKDVWHYHTSRVYFEDGAVVHWEATSEHPLKARGDLDPLHSQTAAFTYGFTKAQVRAIQGEPVNETDRAWDYGVSRVYFENDRVVGWSESPINPLRAKP